MKSKFILSLVTGLALAAHAQDNTAASTNAPTPAPVLATPATETVAPAPAATAPVAPATNETAAASSVIPLIQFVDVPLTAAIENLARQAGLNYILDPKVNFGGSGPDGKPLSQPSISIRWENLTAEQALYALLTTYDLQVTEDTRSKIVRIAPKDPAAPPPLLTQVIQLKYCSPSNVVTAAQSALTDRRSKVLADVRTSQLVVVATEPEMIGVNDLINRLDTPTKQVLIEARMLETTRNPQSAKGIDWAGTLGAHTFRAGNNGVDGVAATPATPAFFNPATGTTVAATPGTPATLGGIAGAPQLLGKLAAGGHGAFFFPESAFLDSDGLTAVLSFLNQDSDTRVLSTPRTITLDNQTATLSVIRASPIINVTAGTANTTGGSSISYSNLGTVLNVTPRISANNFIELKVVPEVSSVAQTVTKTINGQVFQADSFDVRTIDTRVLIPSGNTLVMGGLVNDQSSKNYSSVPFVGNVPVLGLAFRHNAMSQQQRNLLIFITPTIVKDSDFIPTSTDFFKNEVPGIQPEKIHYWDSGKPIDWSKPKKVK